MSDEEKPEVAEATEGKVCPDCGKVHPPGFETFLEAVKAVAAAPDEDESEAESDGPEGAAIFEVDTRTGESKQVAGEAIPAEVRQKIKALMRELGERALLDAAEQKGSDLQRAMSNTAADLATALPLIRKQLETESAARVAMKVALFHKEQALKQDDLRQACLSWGLLAVNMSIAVGELYRLATLLESNGINPWPDGHPNDFLRQAAKPPATKDSNASDN